MNINFSERYPEMKAAFGFEVDQILFSEQSPFQKIEILQTPGFGKVLIIDGCIMLTERDEFVYHEMIAHPPLFVHPHPEKILIIGGGDGGTARECLRHPSVAQIDLVDIDELVSQACLAHLPAIAGALLSEKVRCRFEDGVAYVKNCPERYDLIIIDSTDPISVGEGLFSREFYQNCHRLLREDGILVNQSESPSWLPKIVKGVHSKLNAIFPRMHFYQAHIPTYPSGHWVFGFASKRCHPVDDFQQDRYRSSGMKFRYYNQALHAGAFAIPTFFQELIDDAR